MPVSDRILVFFGVWAAFGAGMMAFMWLGSLHTKRIWLPRLMDIHGVLFVGAVYWVIPDLRVLYFAVPMAILTTVLNRKLSTLCSRCGAYHQRFPFQTLNFCSKCGADLS